MTAPAKAAPMREDVTRTERLKLTDREQMLDAQSLCLPCKLCGGSAVITDAGPGAGYYIKCENSLSFPSHKGCLIDERRVSGWAYNVADWWNRLAHTARPDAHSDDVAVDLFAAKMKAKLAAARAKGRNGWDDPTLCAADYLRTLLNEHVGKGDPVDVANFCMMLSHRDESTARPDAGDEDVRYKSALNQIADLGSCASGKRPAHKLLQDAIDIAIGAL